MNTLLVICTLGLSAIISSIYGAFRKKCPTCGHPLSWHSRTAEGRFYD
jgi:hypothetical protein